MATVVHFECRNAAHLASRSRRGFGGIVMHHGTFGYCDGLPSDGEHRWVRTGGVFLEQLLRGRVADDTLRLKREDSSYSARARLFSD